MHLDVIEGFALTEIVVISSGQQTRSVAPDNCFEVTPMDVECHSFEPVHFCLMIWSRSDARTLTMKIGKLEFAVIRGWRRKVWSSTINFCIWIKIQVSATTLPVYLSQMRLIKKIKTHTKGKNKNRIKGYFHTRPYILTFFLFKPKKIFFFEKDLTFMRYLLFQN